MSESASVVTTPETGRIVRPVPVKVWDVFVRVSHWLLVILFAIAWYSGGIWDTPHLAAGYGVIAVIAARVVWGFIGSQNARFSSFVHGPRVTMQYIIDMLHMRAPRYVGHNPAGAAMVIALLVTIAVICISGVMMTTDAFWGVKWVDNLHAAASTFALILVGLHIGGVIYAGIEHGENLVRSMITGLKRGP
jgi:cytochrome b